MAFPDGWGQSQKLTIPHRFARAALSDFPVLLTEAHLAAMQVADGIFDADGAHPAIDGGGDIRFSSDDAGLIQLPCEVNSFVIDNDPANGTCQVWIKLPAISPKLPDTTFYIWWEKVAETQPARDNEFGSDNVWDADFENCYHLEDLNDSTSHQRNLTDANTGDVAGKVEDCREFDGANSRLTYVSVDVNGLTLEMVFRSDGQGESTTPRLLTFTGCLALWLNYAGGKRSLVLYMVTDDVDGTWETAAAVFVDSTWTHLFLSIDKSDLASGPTLRLNGQAVSMPETQAPTGTAASSDGGGILGDRGNAVVNFDGKIDEARISSAERSTAWGQAVYDNIFDGGFVEVGDVSYPPVTALSPRSTFWHTRKRLPGMPSRVFDGPAYWDDFMRMPPPVTALSPRSTFWHTRKPLPGVPSRTFTDAALRGKHCQELRGLYRVFNYLTGADTEGWRVYHKVGSPPNQAPGDLWASSASEPFTAAPLLDDGVHYFSVTYFDGVLESGFRPVGPNGEPYLRLTIAGGVEVKEPPQVPAPWQLELRPNGVVRVVGFYTKAADADLGGAAEEWSLGVTYNGAAPAADTPTYTEAMEFQGHIAQLSYDLPAQGHGTTVKVRLQTRRDDGGWTYSEGSTIETATADATGPAAPAVTEGWPGRMPEDL